MKRMWVLRNCFGIRSECRLFEVVHLNLADPWFCRLDLEGVRLRCMSEGLLGRVGIAIDACVIGTDGNRARGILGAEASVLQVSAGSRAVREYLVAFDEPHPAGDDDNADPPARSKNVALPDPSARWAAALGRPP